MKHLNEFGTAPRLPGVKTRLSSPLVAGAVLMFFACAAALMFVLPGCNASVEARSHPRDGVTNSAPAKSDAKSDTKLTVTTTTETVTHADGSQTVTVTTCTCDGKSCKKDIKVTQIPAPKPAPAAPTATLSTRPSPFTVVPDIVAQNAPDTSLELPPEPDFVLAIAESDPASARRLTLSQKTERLVIRADFTGLDRPGSIDKAKDIVGTLATLELPLPKPDAATYVVKVKVDEVNLVEASTNVVAGEKPEDTRERLRRFIKASTGIFDKASQKATLTLSAPTGYDTKGPTKV